ncbi:uncharacterized protein LOC130656886 isoform X2 [Hydractinia symbiolongicarpus]|uniref:uncharacterized protein LOC130656886 isoform X2 n=1 Tax=Hydractinia symbiolongicarpus TaxID=13093 RepID=UPI00254F239F|nr:uncharacterized protein LOC130656886 isoform X2 [Hydractinia symbiolongicarpus]
MEESCSPGPESNEWNTNNSDYDLQSTSQVHLFSNNGTISSEQVYSSDFYPQSDIDEWSVEKEQTELQQNYSHNRSYITNASYERGLNLPIRMQHPSQHRCDENLMGYNQLSPAMQNSNYYSQENQQATTQINHNSEFQMPSSQQSDLNAVDNTRLYCSKNKFLENSQHDSLSSESESLVNQLHHKVPKQPGTYTTPHKFALDKNSRKRNFTRRDKNNILGSQSGTSSLSSFEEQTSMPSSQHVQQEEKNTPNTNESKRKIHRPMEKEKKYNNTMTALERAGILDITLQTAQLIKKNDTLQKDIDMLEEIVRVTKHLISEN